MMDLHLSRSGVRPVPAPPDRGQTGWYKEPLAGILAGCLVLIAAFGLAPTAQALEGSDPATIAVATVASPELAHHPREWTFMKRQWGIEVLFVRQTAAGYMLEFRYKVIDAQKAKPLFDRQTKPLLTHAESGAQLIVPTPAKVGALRNSNTPKDGHTYWMFFANPGKLVQSGERVNIEIGEFLVEGLVVK